MHEITPYRETLLLSLLAFLTVVPVQAQELVGRVRMPDAATPAPGVILIAVRPGDAVTVRRAITGADGSFVLRLPKGTHRLRALRVGFRPTELGEVVLAAGERRRADFTLTEVTVVLTTVTSRAAARCAIADRAGGVVATLFDEARKALLSSQLSPPEGQPTARILLEQAVDEVDGTPRVAPQREVRNGFAARPFRSAPPAQLTAFGYTRKDPDGTTFFAPDANVLLSDQFAATHCLRLARADPALPERVGIAFEPVGPARGITRVRGTLWLERSTFGLQRLEFSYVGLPAGLDRAGLGGFIDFTQLADGLWFEDGWEIRMPRLRVDRRVSIGAIGLDASADQVQLDAIQRTGGHVLAIERAGRVMYLAARGEIELPAPEDSATLRTSTLLIRAACSSRSSDATSLSSALVGVVRESDARPSNGARVVATWQDEHRIDSRDHISWKDVALETVAEIDGVYALCGLPRERRFLIRAKQGPRLTPPMIVRFHADVDHARADLRFVSTP